MKETSTVRPIFTAAALASMRVFAAPTRTLWVACISARLAGSPTAGLRETIPFEGNPVLAAFMASGFGGGGFHGVAEASTEAGAGDSSYEERKP